MSQGGDTSITLEDTVGAQPSYNRLNGGRATCVTVVPATPLFMHTAAGLVIFTLVWSYTLGGYTCSLPLFLYLFVYAYGLRQLLSTGIIRLVFTNLLTNVVCWFHSQRRSLIFIVTYWVVKVLLMIFYPQGEKSNGTPLSLILFSAFYILIFIAPTVVTFLAVKCAVTLSFILSKLCVRRQISADYSNKKHSSQKYMTKSKFYSALRKWKISVSLILFLTMLTYIVDGDLTSVVRFTCTGKPCWPLLVPSDMQDKLPYYLKHAWIKSWHKIFDGYQPIWLITKILFIGREMEVIHTLPLLIGLFILSQLFLPREFATAKGAFFGCISGVILSGIVSGSLKLLFHRYRPNAYGNPYYWTGPSTTHVNHLYFSKLDLSFPCGHTSITSVIATCLYLALTHGNKRCFSRIMNIWLIVCLYFYPCLVMVSRVSDCYHWASDGMFGVSISLFVVN